MIQQGWPQVIKATPIAFLFAYLESLEEARGDVKRT